MKLKFYLRGIGIGIIVAVAICICAGLRTSEKTMSDDEVIKRAKELGMTQSSVLTETEPADEVAEIKNDETEPAPAQDIVNAQDEATLDETPATDEQVAEESEEVTPEATPEPTEEPTPEPTEEPTPEPTAEAVAEPEETTEESGDYVIISVEKGNGSDTVARKLESAGLIDNASEYDKWLMQNGYDRIISAGAHKIPKGAGKEEIAKIICNRK